MDSRRIQRAAGSALIGAAVALPDYVDSPRRRLMGWAALACTGVGVLALDTGRPELSDPDATLVLDQIRQEIGDVGLTPGPDSDDRGPVLTWLLIAVLLLIFALGVVLSVRLELATLRALAGFFRRRGVPRPYTLTGALYAALLYAILELGGKDA